MTREEVLARYKLDKNLSGMDSHGLDLSHANLRDANLWGAGTAGVPRSGYLENGGSAWLVREKIG